MGFFCEETGEQLSLFVRHSAWLNAKVEQPGSGNIAAKVKPKSRLEQMRIDREDQDYAPPLPPVDAAHLIGYLWEAGPTAEGPMGNAPLSETDLRAWQENSGIDLQPWESRLLRRLSREYLVQLQQAEKQDCMAPWLAGLPLAERRKAVADKIDKIFG